MTFEYASEHAAALSPRACQCVGLDFRCGCRALHSRRVIPTSDRFRRRMRKDTGLLFAYTPRESMIADRFDHARLQTRMLR